MLQLIREMVCENLEFLGIELDKEKNDKKELIISKDNSKVKVLRIPTNEELVIAMDTHTIVEEILAAKK